MRSDELRFAEAVAALTARLVDWGVEDPHDKAHQYVADMRRQGWRPSGPRVETPSYVPTPTPPPAEALAQARAAIAAARIATTQEPT